MPDQKPVSGEQDNRIDTHQLAKRWCLSQKSIARMRQHGTGPHYLRIRGRILYRMEDVLAYEQSNVFAGVGQRVSGEDE